MAQISLSLAHKLWYIHNPQTLDFDLKQSDVCNIHTCYKEILDK